MFERYLPAEEEYEVAAWYSTLLLMQRLPDRIDEQYSVAKRVCSPVLHKPDEFLDEFRRFIAPNTQPETAEGDFIHTIGAARKGRLVQGLSDAAILLTDNLVSQHMCEKTSFKHLVPVVDEVTDFCDRKFLKSVSHADLKETSYQQRIAYARKDADFYIRMYAETPEVAAISPLYL